MVKNFFFDFPIWFKWLFYRVWIKQPNIDLGVASLASNFECPNHLSERDKTIFEILPKYFRNFRKQINYKSWSSQSCSGVLSEYYQGLRVLPPNMTAQIIVVFEIWLFLWFFQKFSENLNYYYFLNIWNSQPCSWVLSEYSKELQIVPPNMTVHILVVFEMWRFL